MAQFSLLYHWNALGPLMWLSFQSFPPSCFELWEKHCIWLLKIAWGHIGHLPCTGKYHSSVAVLPLVRLTVWSISPAKLISLCPNLECTLRLWVARYTHVKLAVGNNQLSVCMTNRRSAFQMRTLSEFNLAEMVYHPRMQSNTLLLAHIYVHLCGLGGVAQSRKENFSFSD